jgi:hypothetical protein
MVVLGKLVNATLLDCLIVFFLTGGELLLSDLTRVSSF